MTVILLLLIALWFGASVPGPLKDTKVDHAAQSLKEKMNHYVPAPRVAPPHPGESGA